MNCASCGIELCAQSLRASQYDLLQDGRFYCDVCRHMFLAADHVFRKPRHYEAMSAGDCGEPSNGEDTGKTDE